MKTYTFTIKNRWGEMLNKSIEAESLEKALEQAATECDEQDDTGYFIDLKDADVPSLERSSNFHKFEFNGEPYGVILEELSVA